MNENRSFTVTIWRPRGAPPLPRARHRRRFWSSRLTGLVGTFLVHGVVFQSVLLGARVSKLHAPEIQCPGAAFIKSESEPAEGLMLIELPTSRAAAKPLHEDFASTGSAPRNLLVTISPDPLPHIEIPPDAAGDAQDTQARIDSGDPAARAELFGRYTGQINARIERAWRRPRSAVNPDVAALQDTVPARASNPTPAEDSFRCQARIIQDERGRVQEVQLLDCNGTIAWQHSLVIAILAASPLPAPPAPSVFTRAVTLTFVGYPYGPGSADDDYIIEPRPGNADGIL